MASGINDTPGDLKRLKEVLLDIAPDKVQLNTLDRPGTEDWAVSVSDALLRRVAARLGPRAEVIGGPARDRSSSQAEDISERVIALVSRRPCTLEDLESSTGAKRPILLGKLEELTQKGEVRSYKHKNREFYVRNRD